MLLGANHPEVRVVPARTEIEFCLSGRGVGEFWNDKNIDSERCPYSIQHVDKIEFIGDDDYKKGDTILDFNKFKVYLDAKSVFYLKDVTLDYQEDLDFMNALIAKRPKNNNNEYFSIDEIINVIDSNEELLDINFFRHKEWAQNQALKTNLIIGENGE